MPINTEKSLRLISTDLPAMVQASESDAYEAYEDFMGLLSDVMGDVEQPEQSDFDWNALKEMIDFRNDGPDKRIKVAKDALQTSILIPGRPDGLRHHTADVPLRLHGDEGLFVAANADGRIVAYERLPSPEVPSHYGSGDPYAFEKIAAAAVVAKIKKQGATSGEGYQELTALRQANGKVDLPHIGNATLFDRDGTVLGYAGTTGRILTPEAFQYLRKNRRDIAARMVYRGVDQRNPNDLAGLIDSLSGEVALRVAFGKKAVKAAHIVELPDPNSPQHKNVDWN